MPPPHAPYIQQADRDALLGVLASVGRGMTRHGEETIALALAGWVHAFREGGLRPDSPEFLLAGLFGWPHDMLGREAWKSLPRAILQAGENTLAFQAFTGKPAWATGQSCEPGKNIDRFHGTTPIGYSLAMDSPWPGKVANASGLTVDMVRRGGQAALPWLRQPVPGQDRAWLGWAVRQDDEALVQAVLDAGVSPNETEHGCHSLALACSPGVVHRLLEAGARVEDGAAGAEKVLMGNRAWAGNAALRDALEQALGLAVDKRMSGGHAILHGMLDGEAPSVQQARSLSRLHVPGFDAPLSAPAVVALGAILGSDDSGNGGMRRSFWSKATTALHAVHDRCSGDAVEASLVGAAYALLRNGETDLFARTDRAVPLVLRAAEALDLPLTRMTRGMAAWLAGRPDALRIGTAGRWTWMAFEAAFNPCDVAREGLSPPPVLEFRSPPGQRDFRAMAGALWKGYTLGGWAESVHDDPRVELGLLAAGIVGALGAYAPGLPAVGRAEPGSHEDGKILMEGFERLQAYARRYVTEPAAQGFLAHVGARSTATAAWLASQRLAEAPARHAVRKRG